MPRLSKLIASRATHRAMLKAAEASEALESAFLGAQTEIWASFPCFDPDAPLRTPLARLVGNTWGDMITDLLRRGIRLHLVLSDYDPILCPDQHRATSRAARLLRDAATRAGPEAQLFLTAAMHPAQLGLVARLALWPVAMWRLGRLTAWLNRLDCEDRAGVLADLPGLAPYLLPQTPLKRRLSSLPRQFPATHHQKLAVIDRRTLYLGGPDIGAPVPQDPAPPVTPGWHDLLLTMTGPVVGEAQAHLESFVDISSGTATPGVQRRLLRLMTRPGGIAALATRPRPYLSEFSTAHDVLARRSDSLIYIETQIFRDIDLACTLARYARDKPALHMILILPVAAVARGGPRARFGAYRQRRALHVLRQAFGARLLIAAAQPRAGRSLPNAFRAEPACDIATKVALFDTRTAIVSSANLDHPNRSWNTETGVFLNMARDVEVLRNQMMVHWLSGNPGPAYFNPETAVASWRSLVQENVRLPVAARRGALLPYDTNDAG